MSYFYWLGWLDKTEIEPEGRVTPERSYKRSEEVPLGDSNLADRLDKTELLKLQKQYRSGIIKEEDLTEEQIKSLCDLNDKQIADLKKSNEIRKQKLLEYRRKNQIDT